MTISISLPTLYLARHAETVFNRAARMQGQLGHSPLTMTGFAQAQAMGDALRAELGPKPDVALWCSSAGRTRQTMAIICEHLELDYMDVIADDRLQEIHVGTWEGRYYREVLEEHGPYIDMERRLFSIQPPGGESYADIAVRMTDWLQHVQTETRPIIAISHGMAARVLRGLIVGGDLFHDTKLAPDAPQGTVFKIQGAEEQAIHLGSGSHDEKRLRAV
jgi:broad specificity phosphatase PhoE